MDKKAIVIFDTNKLLQDPSDKRYYSQIDLGGDYWKLISEFLPDSFLSGNVSIAIPKLCIEEIKQKKIEDFDSRRESVIATFKKVQADIEIAENLLEFEFKEIKQKEDAYKMMTDELDKYVAEEELTIIDYPKDENLKPIIERALKRKTPFMKAKEGSDTGFKDTAIWHSIMECEELNEYNYCLFYTQDTGFDLNCLDEFKKKFGKKMDIVRDYEELKAKLEALYPEEERKKVKVKSQITNYFIENLQKVIWSELSKDKRIQDVEILDPYIDSEELDDGCELTSKIKIFFVDDERDPAEVKMKTKLNDVFEIQSTRVNEKNESED